MTTEGGLKHGILVEKKGILVESDLNLVESHLKKGNLAEIDLGWRLLM